MPNLKAYLERTTYLRSNCPLFISYTKPHKPVSKDVACHLCKDISNLSAIDVNKNSSHSCRSAVSSYLKDRVKISHLRHMHQDGAMNKRVDYSKFELKDIF